MVVSTYEDRSAHLKGYSGDSPPGREEQGLWRRLLWQEKAVMVFVVIQNLALCVILVHEVRDVRSYEDVKDRLLSLRKAGYVIHRYHGY